MQIVEKYLSNVLPNNNHKTYSMACIKLDSKDIITSGDSKMLTLCKSIPYLILQATIKFGYKLGDGDSLNPWYAS